MTHSLFAGGSLGRNYLAWGKRAGAGPLQPGVTNTDTGWSSLPQKPFLPYWLLGLPISLDSQKSTGVAQLTSEVMI